MTVTHDYLIEHALHAVESRDPGLYDLVKGRCRDHLATKTTRYVLAMRKKLTDPDEEMLFIVSAVGYVSGYGFIADHTPYMPMPTTSLDRPTKRAVDDVIAEDGCAAAIDAQTMFGLRDYAADSLMQNDTYDSRYLGAYGFIRGAQQACVDNLCGNIDEAIEAHPMHAWVCEQRQAMVANVVRTFAEHQLMREGNILSFIDKNAEALKSSGRSVEALMRRCERDINTVAPLFQESRIAYGDMALHTIASHVMDMANAWMFALEGTITHSCEPIEELPEDAQAIIQNFMPTVMNAARFVGVDVSQKVTELACIMTSEIEYTDDDALRAVMNLPAALAACLAMNYGLERPPFMPQALQDEFAELITE